MTTLAARVLEAIEAAERLALAASPGPWHVNAEHDEVLAVDGITVCEGFALGNRQLRATVDHVVGNDPTAALRRCEADRRVWWRHNESYSPMSDMRQCEGCNEAWPCPELSDLAYALGVPLEQEET